MTRLRSQQLITTASLLLASAALTSSHLARADIAAPEYCPSNDAVGQSCSTAGPDFDQEGLCEEVACDGGGPCGLLCELAPDAGPITNPPDAGPAGNDDAGPTPDDGGPTQPPPYDAGPSTTPDSGPAPTPDSGAPTTTDAGIGATTDAGTNPNGANGGSTLASTSSCSTIGAGLGGQAGGGFFALGALGAIIATASRRRRKK